MVFVMDALETKQEELSDLSHKRMHFLDLLGMQYKKDISIVDFYDHYRKIIIGSLKKKGDVIMWQNNMVLEENEELSPTFEELILAVVLGLIDTRLPSHVWDHYHPLLGNTKSIMDYKMDILAEVPSFLKMITDELPAVCKGDEDPPCRYSMHYQYLLKGAQA